MKFEIQENKEAIQKLKEYRQIKEKDLVHARTPLGTLVLVFNCPEVKGLGGSEEYKLTPSTVFPSSTVAAKLLLDIEIPGRGENARLAFRWGEIPRAKTKAKFLVFMAAKKPGWVKNGGKFSQNDLLKLAALGCLDIDLMRMKENFTQVLMPIEALQGFIHTLPETAREKAIMPEDYETR